MSRLVVYRVEHEATGEGPFVGSSPVRPTLLRHCRRQSLVDASVDISDFRDGYHYCGTLSLAHVHEWFGPLRQELLAAGYRLIEYQPLRTNVRYGASGRQVGFPKYEATPRRVLDWDADGIPVGSPQARGRANSRGAKR